LSLHRRAAARDANEPAIRTAFTAHGWHTEQVSGKGMPDLLAWPKVNGRGGWRICLLVEVKMPKGALKPAQEEKWAALAEKGIPVYVVRTAEDVAALVRGELAAWAPEVSGSIRAPRPHGDDKRATHCGQNGCRALRPCRKHDVGGTRSGVPKAVTEHVARVRKPRFANGDMGNALCRIDAAKKMEPSPGSTPPRSRPAHSTACQRVQNRDAREPCTCGAEMNAAKEAEETFAPPCCERFGRVGEHHWSCSNAPPLGRTLR
jgi:hypothetical protein